jgi:FAD/FMN-containing dehydrogenase
VITVTTGAGIVGRVLRRGDEGYEHYRRGTCWHDRVPERYPEVIVIATTDDDVAGAVALANREDLGIAVRSGGHSWAASHLRDNTVLIDLSNLRRTEIDEESLTATVQPGMKGSELGGILAARGLFFPVGHNAGISLGGYLLQGGYGWAGRDYGPACMSVIGVDVVTADGRFVHADETENSALLWAARGSGPGFFAVVTKFYLKLYPRRAVTMASTYIFPKECVDDVFALIHEVGTDTPAEVIGLITRMPESGGEPAVLLGVYAFADTEQEALDQLNPFDETPFRERALVAETFQLTDHVSLTNGAADVIDEDKRWIADNVGTHASYAEMSSTLHEMLADWPPAPSHLAMFNWAGWDGQPERPDMAFSNDDELYYAIYTAWTDPADDEKYISWTSDSLRAWEPYASGTMLADENLQHRPSRFVTDENLARLDEMRTTWDPARRFVSWLGRPDTTTRGTK